MFKVKIFICAFLTILLLMPFTAQAGHDDDEIPPQLQKKYDRRLADGKIAAAGLDVLPEEPSIREEAELLRSFFSEKHDLETLLADHVLLRMRNVIITPHSAFNTTEAVERILKTTGENIRAFIHGKPQNIVNELKIEQRKTAS